MCEPVTLGIATGLAVAGALASTYANYRQVRFQQAMAERQSTMAGQAAGDAQLRGDIAAQQAVRQGSTVIGSQKAAAGASGVDITSGSPAQMIGDTAGKSALDVATVKSNAAREAWGYEVEQGNYQLQAQQASSAGGWALLGGGLSAAGSALGGGARTYKSLKEHGGNWFG